MNALRRLALFGGIALFLAGRVAIGQVTTDRSGASEWGTESGPTLRLVAQYKYGDNRASLLAAERLTLGATDEAARKALAAQYAAVLAGPATVDGKRFVCRQLGLIGTAAEVPALEGLLADEQLAFAARSALERIPGDESLAALRRAAEKAKGLTKAGLIQSLGVRRDPKAVFVIYKALQHADHVVAAAALNSLGRIGGREAHKILDYFATEVTPDLRPQLFQSLLFIAEDLQAHAETEYALRTLESLQAADPPASVRAAALLARLELLGDKGGSLLTAALAGSDPVLQSAAIRALHLDPKESFLKELAGKFAGLPPAVQLRVVRALADGRQAAALPIVSASGGKQRSGPPPRGPGRAGQRGRCNKCPRDGRRLAVRRQGHIKASGRGPYATSRPGSRCSPDCRL